MTPHRAYLFLLMMLVVMYGAKLIGGRLVLLNDAYWESTAAFNKNKRQSEKCDDDDTTYHTFTRECIYANDFVDGHPYPIVTAIGIVARETHSCVEFPCSDIPKNMLESWSVTVFVALLLLFAFFFALRYASVRIEQTAVNHRIDSDRAALTKSDFFPIEARHNPATIELLPDAPSQQQLLTDHDVLRRRSVEESFPGDVEDSGCYNRVQQINLDPSEDETRRGVSV